MPDLVRVEPLRPGIAALTLARPERRNALSIALLKALVRELEALHAAGAARVVILRGAGPVFSAGLDLAEAANPELVEESALRVAAAFSIQVVPQVPLEPHDQRIQRLVTENGEMPLTAA